MPEELTKLQKEILEIAESLKYSPLQYYRFILNFKGALGWENEGLLAETGRPVAERMLEFGEARLSDKINFQASYVSRDDKWNDKTHFVLGRIKAGLLDAGDHKTAFAIHAEEHQIERLYNNVEVLWNSCSLDVQKFLWMDKAIEVALNQGDYESALHYNDIQYCLIKEEKKMEEKGMSQATPEFIEKNFDANVLMLGEITKLAENSGQKNSELKASAPIIPEDVLKNDLMEKGSYKSAFEIHKQQHKIEYSDRIDGCGWHSPSADPESFLWLNKAIQMAMENKDPEAAFEYNDIQFWLMTDRKFSLEIAEDEYVLKYEAEISQNSAFNLQIADLAYKLGLMHTVQEALSLYRDYFDDGPEETNKGHLGLEDKCSPEGWTKALENFNANMDYSKINKSGMKYVLC